jgi:5-methylcytosine-specific restriction endonuclease McrA
VSREVAVVLGDYSDPFDNKGDEMLPFDTYPDGDRGLLGVYKGSNCRHEYGLKLHQLTGQHSCAYCGMSLVDCFEHWLMMTVDHVVPDSACKDLGIYPKWIHDYSNLVLCCHACNNLDNHYKLPKTTVTPKTPEEFHQLRDDTFRIRKERILKRREEEREYFECEWKKTQP